ncbi:nuclease-related domain-containing protein [Magnetospira sp. QH-2]|uniref:nuclease-related domain-containing protein n=1 Tax=Magnetospira sp. (strain QH-2) TaxID=1288970 RepID=UPI0003E81BEC|nr:nuclease-related domain-containing protein [Magnetospira sp. QH-2]CCQ75745.1 Membrane protein of unknown function [Magnetospira sp. QH-2]
MVNFSVFAEPAAFAGMAAASILFLARRPIINQIKGTRAEKKVIAYLKKQQIPFLTNVFIPVKPLGHEQASVTEIDIVAFVGHAVAIIEVKAWRGNDICGDTAGWYIRNGKKATGRQAVTGQQSKHLRAATAIAGPDHLYSVIALPNIATSGPGLPDAVATAAEIPGALTATADDPEAHAAFAALASFAADKKQQALLRKAHAVQVGSLRRAVAKAIGTGLLSALLAPIFFLASFVMRLAVYLIGYAVGLAILAGLLALIMNL